MKTVEELIRDRSLPLLQTDTYMVREIKTARNAGSITAYAENLGFRFGSGEQQRIRKLPHETDPTKIAPNTLIFKLRTVRRPAMWYTTVTETLPEKIEFEDKNDVSMLMIKDSVGHAMLRQIIDEEGVSGVIENYGFQSRHEIDNILYKRKRQRDGRPIFRILPSYVFIRKLKERINPEYWYVFPDEIASLPPHLD